MIEAIITLPPNQEAQVAKMVRYAEKLDGTKLRVIPVTEANERFRRENPDANFFEVQASGLHEAARIMKGKPFAWVEADSPPLHKEWLRTLTDEYERAGKHFLISSDQNPPHDMVGGIGIYGPDTHWMLPKRYREYTWDLFLTKQLGPLTHRTPLIQHSYGVYDELGGATPHRFPRDQAMLRPDAVIFHRDKFLDLLPRPAGAKKSFYHTGDLGDIIAALPIIRHLGGGSLVIGNHLNPAWRRMEGARFAAIEPLLSDQPYIKEVRFDHGAECAADLSEFRAHHRRDRTLTASQAAHLGLDEPDMSPWLTATPSLESKGRIVVARTERYQNPLFPWDPLVNRHRDRILFVGTGEEHKQFTARYGPVPYRPTANLWEVAALISGSALFVGNQSSPCWIAMGLGHPLIQETSHVVQDSVVPRANAQFYLQGLLTQPRGVREFQL